MKSHLKTSLIPLTSGLPLTADCGKLVRNAQILHTWDDTKPGDIREQLSSINNCRDCVDKLGESCEEIEYLYSIAEGDAREESAETA